MSGYLKVLFEGSGTQRLIDLLTNEEWEVAGAQPGMLLIAAEEQLAKKLKKAVWKLNGGLWCEVSLISYDDADKYL